MASVTLERRTGNEVEAPDELAAEQNLALIEEQTQREIDTLPQLVTEREIDKIKRLRREGDALAMAAQRSGYEAQARHFGRMMLYAAAAEGLISLEAWDAIPRGKKTAAAEVERLDERGRGLGLRGQRLHALASAYDRGRMEAVLNGCGDVLTVSRANLIASQLGMAAVSPRDLRKQLEAIARRRGVSVHALLVEIGCASLQAQLTPSKLDRIAIRWTTVRLIIKPLDIRPDVLPPHRRRRRGGPRVERSKWITHRYRSGNGTPAKALNQWYAFRDEVRRLNWFEEKPLLAEAAKRVSDDIHKGRKPSDEDMHTITDIVIREAHSDGVQP